MKKADIKRMKARIKALERELKDAGESAALIGAKDERHLYADAILGVAYDPRPAVIYSYDKLVVAFMRANKW